MIGAIVIVCLCAVEKAGGKCLPCVVDIRDDDQLESAVNQTVERFGGIDILVNNASAIHLTGTVDTPMKRCVCVCVCVHVHSVCVCVTVGGTRWTGE